MSRAMFVAFFSLIASIHAINRPVYKIVLTQKGYAQFLQYDVETPPLREFTFCTWIRVFDLVNDQSIFTYATNNNNRVVRLWLDSGGRYMKVAIKDKITSALRVDVVKDVWSHVCLSYQSDFGALALYFDSRLVSCESSSNLYGIVLPGGGRVIIGYGGTGNDGASNGFEGEIFGSNMILSSTIERNYSLKIDPLYEQKHFAKNKIKKETKDMNYIILSNLLTNGKLKKIENSYTSRYENQTKNYQKLHPHSFVEYNVDADPSTGKPPTNDSTEQDIFDFTISDFTSTNKDKIDFYNSADNEKYAGKYRTQFTKQYMGGEISNSDTQNVPTLSHCKIPPQDVTEAPNTMSIYKLKDSASKSGKKMYRDIPVTELSEIETPPPVDLNTNGYGQMTSSKFAGTVLNYLKSINFKNSEHFLRKVPQTIPLYKLTDSHPYSSDFVLYKLRPSTKIQFKKRNLVQKRYDIVKRDPQINVQILEDDLRSNILKMHAQLQPKNIEITNKGEPKKYRKSRFYRNASYEPNLNNTSNSLEELSYPRPFTLSENLKGNHRYFFQPSSSMLPFWKTFEYPDQNTESPTPATSKDMYSKSLSNANKWHNVKSYSNDYTPRKINMDSDETNTDRRKQYPSIRLNYVHDKRKHKAQQDPTIVNARKLAVDVSNQSTLGKDSVSILKYNNGYFKNKEPKTISEEIKGPVRKRVPSKRNLDITSFDKHVKIGNALNERDIIGNSEKQKERSFVGGNENIPDINRYRSDIDNQSEKVPASLGSRVCKNVELYDRVLYVQPDGSIDMTHILSPVKKKNIAIEFVLQNYKKCSLTDSSFQRSAMLLIDWSKTPVRLFGGAYPKMTTDLCGFF